MGPWGWDSQNTFPYLTFDFLAGHLGDDIAPEVEVVVVEVDLQASRSLLVSWSRIG